MIKYHIAASNPNRHYIIVNIIADTLGNDQTLVQLPSWRPGRYELGNFAQNIREWKAFDDKNNPLKFRKITKDLWHVDTAGTQTIRITYSYFANQLDAGSTYYDHLQLYVNPVNCLAYLPGRIEEECELSLTIPPEYKIASALKFDNERVARISNYHQLADSPFIASASLQSRKYVVLDHEFYIHFQGICKPDWNQIIHHFESFSKKQLELFGELPVSEYHFLYQIANQKQYHGVEHVDSTVIAIGPGYNLMQGDTYADFVGVSSHELFHSWNVKTIRPTEMMPYDYSKENYSNLGYVAEGVTTYYGDLILLRCKVYDWHQYTKEVVTFLNRHFHVFGRYYQSLAESSFDTWLDGYKPGVPDRKVNMYVKGMLVAFVIDIAIRKATGLSKSLDDVMKELFLQFGKQEKGFSEDDYLNLINTISGEDFTDLFNKYVWGLEPLEPILHQTFEDLGCKWMLIESELLYENFFGIKVKEDNDKYITAIAPDSPADLSGLSIDDEIYSVNGILVNNNLNDLLRFYSDETFELTVVRNKKFNQINLKAGKDRFYHKFKIIKNDSATKEQKKLFESWAHVDF